MGIVSSCPWFDLLLKPSHIKRKLINIVQELIACVWAPYTALFLHFRPHSLAYTHARVRWRKTSWRNPINVKLGSGCALWKTPAQRRKASVPSTHVLLSLGSTPNFECGKTVGKFLKNWINLPPHRVVLALLQLFPLLRRKFYTLYQWSMNFLAWRMENFWFPPEILWCVKGMCIFVQLV